MAKDTKKQTEKSEKNKPAIKSQAKSSCGCGCVLSVKTKQTNTKDYAI